ncbi:MAG: hypothetical protein M1822_002222 [Bathelium mastoideum]|nr:MAG: hypothetical protein M1822_002222 [Bathelium mastoideum]
MDCFLQAELRRDMTAQFIFLAFLAIFEFGSLVCGLAKSSNTFIIGRAVAGTGASGLMNGALVMVTVACNPKLRLLVLAFGISLISVGGIVGPLIGGALTQHAGWQWCFWIFLPLGAITIIVMVFLRTPEQMEKPPIRKALLGLPRHLDVLGFALFAPATAMLLLAISLGGAQFAWSSAVVIGLLCGAAGTLAIFVIWSFYRMEEALIPPSILKHSLVVFGSSAYALQGGSTIIITYYLSWWFQSIKGLSPSSAGLHLLPSVIAQIIGSATSGVLLRRLHYLPIWSIFGSMLAAIGSGLLTTLKPEASVGKWIGYQVFIGYGRGLALQIPVIAIQEGLPGKDIAVATSILTLFQYLGSTVAISAGETIFRNRLIAALHKILPGIDPLVIIDAGATSLVGKVPSEDMAALLKAYSRALTDIFYFPTAATAFAFFLSFGLGWKKIGIEDKEKSDGEIELAQTEHVAANTSPHKN